MNRSLTDREFFTPRPGAQDIYKLIPHAAARQRKASRGVFAKATLASQVSNGDGISEARAACGTDSGFKIKPSGFILKLAYCVIAHRRQDAIGGAELQMQKSVFIARDSIKTAFAPATVQVEIIV